MHREFKRIKKGDGRGKEIGKAELKRERGRKGKSSARNKRLGKKGISKFRQLTMKIYKRHLFSRMKYEKI